MARILLQRGANVTATSEFVLLLCPSKYIYLRIHLSKLWCCSDTNKSSYIRAQLRNTFVRNDLTVLHFAAHQNLTDLGLLFLQNSADPLAKDVKCAFAYLARILLHISSRFFAAVFAKIYSITQHDWLTQHSHCICSGKTPADIALEKGHEMLIELMRYSGIHAVLKGAKSESDEL